MAILDAASLSKALKRQNIEGLLSNIDSAPIATVRFHIAAQFAAFAAPAIYSVKTADLRG